MGCRPESDESEAESNGLMEREKECWLCIELAWVKMVTNEIEHLSIFINVNQ